MNMDTATQLETVTCSRCGGSGEYSYCQMYGRTCFKCSGAKRIYTKRGFAAAQFLKALWSKTASELKVGDKILCDGIPGYLASKWGTVESIRRMVFTIQGASQNWNAV
jgi:hypothetical protein